MAAVCIALSALGALALDPSVRVTQYLMKEWDEKSGLTVSSIESLAQTPDGCLWIGGTDGLARFDGVRFETFQPSRTEELASGYVTALLAEPDGTLWVGTANGLSRRRGGLFRSFTTRDGLAHDVVLCLESDGHGGVWVGTNGGGLSHYSEGRFSALTTRDGLLSDTVSRLYLDRSGTLWIGTDAGVNRLGRGTLTVHSREARMPQQVRRGGAAPFLQLGDRLLDPASGRVAAKVPAGVVFVLEDRDGNLWYAAGESGLFREAAGVAQPVLDLETNRPVQADVLLEDREGGLWWARRSSIHRLKDPEILPLGKPEGLPMESIFSVTSGAGGEPWFANGEGLAALSGGSVMTFPDWVKAAGGGVSCVLHDPERGMMLGSAGGLSAVRGGVVSRIPLPGLPRGIHVISLCRGGPGRLWVGTRGAGLYLLDGERTRRFTSAQGLTDDRIGALCPSRDGSLWVGGTGGLNRLYPDTGRVEKWTTKEGLAANYVLTLLEDGEGILWVGSWGGLSMFREGRLTSFTRGQGLASDVLYQILEDESGRLWVGAQDGIFSVEKRQLEEVARGSRSSITCCLYGTGDGMRTQKCFGTVQPAGCRAGDGRLWFATQMGAAAVDPGRRPPAAPDLHVLIERVLVEGTPYAPSGTVVVPPGPRKLEAGFTAPTFLDPEGVLFRYRLEGAEEAWTEIGTRRVAYYTNLPAGSFVFRVQARRGSGEWCQPGASLSIRFQPFYYETLWFKGLMVLLGVMAVGGGVQWRVSSLKARKRQLEAVVAERTAQLEAANRELERLANEDGMTRIPNIRHFNACLEEEWRRAVRNVKPLSVILVDVDHFKAFNDLYGHPAGDECLRLIASILKGRVRRPGDLAARYGGEEFIVLLVNADAKGAAGVARDLRHGVHVLGIKHEGSDAAKVVTISLGCATTLPIEGQKPSDLIAAADHALYRSKREGRNRVTAVDLAEVSEQSERWT